MKESWTKVNDFSTGATNPESNQEMMAIVMNNLENKNQKKAAPIKPVEAPKAAPAKPAETAAASSAEKLKSEAIFGMMATYLN